MSVLVRASPKSAAFSCNCNITAEKRHCTDWYEIWALTDHEIYYVKIELDLRKFSNVSLLASLIHFFLSMAGNYYHGFPIGPQKRVILKLNAQASHCLKVTHWQSRWTDWRLVRFWIWCICIMNWLVLGWILDMVYICFEYICDGWNIGCVYLYFEHCMVGFWICTWTVWDI